MDIKLGQLALPTAQRDAIHIAIAPVSSDEAMWPGQVVVLVVHDKVGSMRGAPNEHGVGIVDPFLTARIEPGTRMQAQERREQV